MMKYEWDESKNLLNFQNHQVWFEEAKTVFSDPNALEVYDEKNSTELEDRFIFLGLSSNLKHLIVVYCEREDTGKKDKSDSSLVVRIISSRKATKKERKKYERRV